MSNTSITRHELWEELIFGDTDLYERVVHHFPDIAELRGSEEDKENAQEIIRYILRTEKNNILRIIVGRLGTQFGPQRFYRYIVQALETLLSEVPQGFVDEIEEYLKEDIPEPQQLPVQWTEEGTG